jgi:hypothetical protein
MQHTIEASVVDFCRTGSGSGDDHIAVCLGVAEE